MKLSRAVVGGLIGGIAVMAIVWLAGWASGSDGDLSALLGAVITHDDGLLAWTTGCVVQLVVAVVAAIVYAAIFEWVVRRARRDRRAWLWRWGMSSSPGSLSGFYLSTASSRRDCSRRRRSWSTGDCGCWPHSSSRIWCSGSSLERCTAHRFIRQTKAQSTGTKWRAECRDGFGPARVATG